MLESGRLKIFYKSVGVEANANANRQKMALAANRHQPMRMHKLFDNN